MHDRIAMTLQDDLTAADRRDARARRPDRHLRSRDRRLLHRPHARQHRGHVASVLDARHGRRRDAAGGRDHARRARPVAARRADRAQRRTGMELLAQGAKANGWPHDGRRQARTLELAESPTTSCGPPGRCATWPSNSGFCLVDQTKDRDRGERAGAQHRTPTVAADTVRLERSTTAARRGLRLVFEDDGPGIPDIEQALARRLHDGQRPRAGAGRGAPTRQRVRHRFQAGRRDAGRRSRDGRDASAAMLCARFQDRQHASRARGQDGSDSRRRTRSGSRRGDRGSAGARRHGDGDESRQARSPAAASCSCAPFRATGTLAIEIVRRSIAGPACANLPRRCATDTRRGHARHGSRGDPTGSRPLSTSTRSPAQGTALVARSGPATPPASAPGPSRAASAWRTRASACPGDACLVRSRRVRRTMDPDVRRPRSRADARGRRVASRGRGSSASGSALDDRRAPRAHPRAPCGRRGAPRSRSPRSTRGAAVVHFVGRREHRGHDPVADDARSLVSHHGIVGHDDPDRIQEFIYPLPAGCDARCCTPTGS